MTGCKAWGFEETEGVKRYTRNVKFTGPKGEDVEVKMFYDYRKGLSLHLVNNAQPCYRRTSRFMNAKPLSVTALSYLPRH
jgi:hypothetical protein